MINSQVGKGGLPPLKTRSHSTLNRQFNRPNLQLERGQATLPNLRINEAPFPFSHSLYCFFSHSQ